jgi:uncharacterized protein (DUF1697 family)
VGHAVFVIYQRVAVNESAPYSPSATDGVCGNTHTVHRYASAEALKCVSARPGVDGVFAGDSVLYFSRLISKAAQSHLSRVVATPAYQHMTIRDWNTTTRLVDLMSGIQGSGTVMVSRRGPSSG